MEPWHLIEFVTCALAAWTLRTIHGLAGEFREHRGAANERHRDVVDRIERLEAFRESVRVRVREER